MNGWMNKWMNGYIIQCLNEKMSEIEEINE